MPTRVRITRHPHDGRRYQVGETVTLADPTAAKLVATGCAELVGRSANPRFAEFVASFSKAGKGPAAKPYTAPMGFDALSPRAAPKPKLPAAKLPPVSVKLKAAAKVAGRPRNAGDLVVVDENRAAMLVAQGLADAPAKASPRFGEKVAEFRQFDAFMKKRREGITLATLI
jgi:hypothetical protein